MFTEYNFIFLLLSLFSVTSFQIDHKNLISFKYPFVLSLGSKCWVGGSWWASGFCLTICIFWHLLRSAEEFIIHFSPWISVETGHCQVIRKVPAGMFSLGYVPCSFRVCRIILLFLITQVQWDLQDERLPMISHYFLAPLSFRRYLYLSGINLAYEKNVTVSWSEMFVHLNPFCLFPEPVFHPPLLGGVAT